MAKSEFQSVRVAGLCSAIPEPTRTTADETYFDAATVSKISESVGVRVRHVVPDSLCTSDLCVAAAERLIEELQWNRDAIVGLIYVTQTPDYILPATSHVLHRSLRLPVSCCAFDVNLGCSGYVYGLWLASNMVTSLRGKVLLLVGDTISRLVSPQDQSVAFLFGDAGTATALEPGAMPMRFELGADGSGTDHLIVRAGSFRQPHDATTALRTVRDGGGLRSEEDLSMNGAEIFAFTLQRVPSLVKSLLGDAALEVSEIDAFVFHQANRFMLEHIAKRLKIPSERFVIALQDYGNTSSASIPLAITVSDLRTRLQETPLRLVLAGFGVGFSWAGAVVTWGPGVFPELLHVGSATVSQP